MGNDLLSNMALTIDYDDITTWAPEFTTALQPYIPKFIKTTLRSAIPECLEDAMDILFRVADREEIIDATIKWISAGTIVAYHGSRLTLADRVSVQREGLRPLTASDRHKIIIEKLSPHTRWNEVSHRLDSIIDSFGPRMKIGRREGQVHATLSKSGLMNSFNHYLSYGSEFDQRVAIELLGIEGKELLSLYGERTLIQLVFPGNVALQAVHPHFSIDDLRDRGDIPNMVSQFIGAWSYRLAHDDFDPTDLMEDCGMIFYSQVPSCWIADIEVLGV